MRERRLENSLQLGGLLVGQLAGRHLLLDEAINLRREGVGRRCPAAGLIACTG